MAASSAQISVPSSRILSIDALRGAVMALMMVDHVREFFYLHAQVPDPMTLDTPPALFLSRVLAHFCAPIFVGLTGLSAWLYGQKHGGVGAAAGFLFKRGLFLIVLELTVINFAWTFDLTPSTYFLQVIWAIGVSMIALSALILAPRGVVAVLGVIIVAGHNLLDPISFAPGHPAHAVWAILHDRGHIDLPWGAVARTSYPILPWIGVIALGYVIGPWFGPQTTSQTRRRRLVATGLGALTLFTVLRLGNVYGEPAPWVADAPTFISLMSFFNLTKYPPSLAFLLFTLGTGLLVLAALERAPARPLRILATYGGAPLFFYGVHLYALHLMNRLALAVLGPNQGALFSLADMGWVWGLALATAIALWPLCRAFVGLKARSNNPLLAYL